MNNNYSTKFQKHEFLYHYTTVEDLLFILINRTIKFNKVDHFNDISENTRNEYVKFFASCFTYSSNESIPLWHIYANKENGVRIGFPNIKFYDDDFYYFDDKGKKVSIDIASIGSILCGQVEYDDNLASRSPSQGSESIRVTDVYEMACQKRKVWSYEEELRYFIVDDNLTKDAKCLYVSLNNYFFSNLLITYNPFMSDYRKRIIEEATRNLSFEDIKFEESSLRGTIR